MITLFEPGEQAFHAAVMSLCFPHGAQGSAYSMTDGIVSNLDRVWSEGRRPIRVALDICRGTVRALVIFDRSKRQAYVVPLKLSSTVARLGKQAVFLGDGLSAGLLMDAVVREVAEKTAAATGVVK